ncbi:hypothetical protein ACSSS7_005400 [Eimeria intestinalis]
MSRARSLDLTLHEFWDLLAPSKRLLCNRAPPRKSVTPPRQGLYPLEAVTFMLFCIHVMSRGLSALSMPFNGTMLSNENVLASLDTLADCRHGAIAIIEGYLCSRSGAQARRTLKRMGQLRRLILMLKLRWRARSYWHTDDMEVLAQPVGRPCPRCADWLTVYSALAHKDALRRTALLFFPQPFQELKKSLTSVHTLFVAPALASSELIKEVQLLYSVVVVHACCSPETGTAFSTRQQNGSRTDPRSFRRVRAAPLGWGSPTLKLTFEKLSASDEARLLELHADGASGGRGGLAQLILDSTHAPSDRLPSAVAADDFDEFRPSVLKNRKQHAVTEGEIVIKGACVSVGYYRHQTAFQRHLTPRGMYKTGLVATSCGEDFPLLLIGTLPRTVLTSVGEFIDLEEAEKKIRKVPIVRRVMLYADDFNVSRLRSAGRPYSSRTEKLVGRLRLSFERLRSFTE